MKLYTPVSQPLDTTNSEISSHLRSGLAVLYLGHSK